MTPDDAIRRIAASGKAAGVLSTEDPFLADCLAADAVLLDDVLARVVPA